MRFVRYGEIDVTVFFENKIKKTLKDDEPRKKDGIIELTQAMGESKVSLRF